MRVKAIFDEDFVNYKKTSMFIGTSFCSGKCWRETGCSETMCQNNELHFMPIIDVPDKNICKRFMGNPLTSAIVIGGLEPFDQFDELLSLIRTLREDFYSNADVVIYTGYYREELRDQLAFLIQYPNIIVKFGRFIPDRPSRFDDVLGVELYSDNQYAEKIS